MTISPSRRTNLLVPAICVVLVVLVAGCGGVIDDPDRSTVTVTPAAVPDARTATPGTGSGPEIPVSGRFSDPSARAAFHAAVLENASFTLVMTRTIRFVDDDSGGRWELTGQFAPDGRFRLDSRRNGSVFGTADPVRIEYWSDGRRVLEAYVGESSTTANVVRDVRGNPVAPRSVLPLDPRFEDELARIFATTTITSITRLPRGGRPHERVSVTAVGLNDTATLSPRAFGSSISNFTVSMIVDERGFVHRYDLRYAADFAGRQVVVTRSVRYGSVGTTAVERPPWAASLPTPSRGGRYGTSSGSNGSS